MSQYRTACRLTPNSHPVFYGRLRTVIPYVSRGPDFSTVWCKGIPAGRGDRMCTCIPTENVP